MYISYNGKVFAGIKDLVDASPDFRYDKMFKGSEIEYYKEIEFRKENCKMLINIFNRKFYDIEDIHHKTEKEKIQIAEQVNNEIINNVPYTAEKFFACEEFLSLTDKEIENEKDKTTRLLLIINVSDEYVNKDEQKELKYILKNDLIN
jgi:hypothetical protein